MALLPVLRPKSPCARCGRIRKTWVIDFERYEIRICGVCLMAALFPRIEEKPKP